MARRTVNVTFSSPDHARIPDILIEGTTLLLGLRERGGLDAVGEQLRIRRQGGYTGLDVFVMLWLFLAAGATLGLRPFWSLVQPRKKELAALAGRRTLASPAAMSRALGAVEPELFRPVAGWLLAELPGIDPVLRHPTAQTYDARGRAWHVFDIDPTAVTLHHRALPDGDDLPEARRRSEDTGAPGYSGRKRGDIQFRQVPAMHAGTGLWVHAHLSPGNGKGVEDLELALDGIVETCDRIDHPLYRSFVRLDGEHGNVPWFTACRERGVPFITRLNRPKLLVDPDVIARLRAATWYCVPDSGCGPQRSAADIGILRIAPGERTCRPDGTAYEPVSVRVVACIFPKRGAAKRGRTIDGWELELFAVDLHAEEWPAADAIAAYYGRNSFENRIAQQQRELGLDRIVSYHLPGQELATVVGLALWNERVVRGFELARPPEHRPVQQIREPVIDNRVPALWPRDPVLVAQLAELDWETLLLCRPGWRFDAATGEVRCDQDRPLTLTSVRLREGSERAGIILCRPSGGCQACEARPECLHSERQDAAKHLELAIDAELAQRLHARLTRVRRPDRARIVPITTAPGRLNIAEALFLPAEARHALREVFLGATLRVEADIPPPVVQRPRLVAVDVACRQRRRLTWTQNVARNALPDDARVQLHVSGSDALRSMLGENRAEMAVGG
jgi:hypothetical protein